MRSRRLLLALLLAWAGCEALACRDQTIYLTFDYSAATAMADALALDVTVGATHRHYQQPRTPGTTRDTRLTVGNAQTTQTLAPRCTALSLQLASPNVGGLAPADLSASPSDQAAALDDMALAGPTLVFSGSHHTGTSPVNDTMGTLYEDACPPGAALIGFDFSATNEIDNDTPICARADLVAAAGGGWGAVWGPTTLLPFHGPNGVPGNQRLCPANSFVRAFSGTSAYYLQSVMMLCAAIVVTPSRQVQLSADSFSPAFGPAAGNNFGPILCPTGEVATMRRERQDVNIPAYEFGLACSAIAVQ
jgi:hypothetical protein